MDVSVLSHPVVVLFAEADEGPAVEQIVITAVRLDVVAHRRFDRQALLLAISTQCMSGQLGLSNPLPSRGAIQLFGIQPPPRFVERAGERELSDAAMADDSIAHAFVICQLFPLNPMPVPIDPISGQTFPSDPISNP